MYKILVINPGSTSTKIAVFDNEESVFQVTLQHQADELSNFNKIFDQYDFRKKAVLNILEQNGIDISKMDAIVGRGGSVRPMKSGTYIVTKNLLNDLRIGAGGEHASNLAGIIASDIANELDIPAFIVDSPVVDEMESIARISGLNGIERKSKFHALNQKAVARIAAKKIGKTYEDSSLIVAHLGGGISVGAHRKGKVIDVYNALDGDGPFSPERSGGLPANDIIKMCFSGEYTMDDMKKKINGQGGLVSYLKTTDCRKISEMVKSGDKNAELIYKAMAYQVSKSIASCAAVLKGEVDVIVLTGGISHDEIFVNWVIERINFISNVEVYPGEYEMLGLAKGGLRVLRKEEEPKIYE